MEPQLALSPPTAEVRIGHVVASVTGPMLLGHMGCKLLGTVRGDFKAAKKPFPHRLVDLWNHRCACAGGWASTKDACLRLGRALAGTLAQADLPGVTLFDTMRKGSDAWRAGGDFLTRAVEELLRLRPGVEVVYQRVDAFCPTLELLERSFGDPPMPFGEYAEEYAHELHAGGRIERAVAHVVLELAAGRLPIFYCTDPFIPGYGSPAQAQEEVPYRERSWLPELPAQGCHRIVLAEEITKFFAQRGFEVRLFEVDQLHDAGAHVRLFHAEVVTAAIVADFG